MAPRPPAFTSISQVLDFRQEQYRDAVEHGTVSPWLFPQAVAPVLLVVAYLVIPANSIWSSNLVRYAVYLAATYGNIWVILNCSSGNMAPSYGIGITSSFYILWTSHILLFHNPKRDFVRVERREAPRQAPEASNGAGKQAMPRTEYYWQPFPSDAPLFRRFEWAQDLLGSFRGMGWNFQTSYCPSLPGFVQEQLRETPRDHPSKPVQDAPVSKAGIRRFDDRATLLRHAGWLMLQGYIAIDIIKTVMSHDAYFWGQLDAPAPAWLPALVRQSWVLTRSYRLWTIMFAIYFALRSLFAMAALLFAGLLGPDSVVRARGEPWLYPDHWGSFSNLYDHGLAGFWGAFWHQTLRTGLHSLGKGALRGLGLSAARGLASKGVMLGAAFVGSGLMHASGSHTMIAATRPWDAFAFFALQALGMLLEQLAHATLARAGVLRALPAPLRKLGTFGWLYAWLFVTAPLLTDDMARGGFFLFELPLPSAARGLGLGGPGAGWFNCPIAWGTTARWHADPQGRWWMSGVAV